MIETAIGVEEYQRRRERVLRTLRGGIGLVLAGEGGAQLHGSWRPDGHFAYLTGILREPGAAVLFDGRNPDPGRRCVLFLKPRDPELETWDGLREPLGAPLREATGFARVMRTPALATLLMQAARRSKRLVCLHPPVSTRAAIPGDLQEFRKVQERLTGVAIEDRTDLINTMRAVKSRAEVRQIRRAIEATAAGFDAALEVLAPGVVEREVQNALESTFIACGAEGPAYNTIVGAGVNSTVLHYNANDRTIEDGDLVCIDAGAQVGGYCADVTRTYPASGRFTKRQREVYKVVLHALKAAIRAARPGVRFHELDEAARGVIEKAGLGDFFLHGIGHHLGIEVHDASPDAPLKPGAVITIEPGVYLRDEKIGVRIEDDILITPKGHSVLTRDIAREPDEIEAQMRSIRRRR